MISQQILTRKRSVLELVYFYALSRSRRRLHVSEDKKLITMFQNKSLLLQDTDDSTRPTINSPRPSGHCILHYTTATMQSKAKQQSQRMMNFLPCIVAVLNAEF